jgi:hypothetical protein
MTLGGRILFLLAVMAPSAIFAAVTALSASFDVPIPALAGDS